MNAITHPTEQEFYEVFARHLRRECKNPSWDFCEIDGQKTHWSWAMAAAGLANMCDVNLTVALAMMMQVSDAERENEYRVYTGTGKKDYRAEACAKKVWNRFVREAMQG